MSMTGFRSMVVDPLAYVANPLLFNLLVFIMGRDCRFTSRVTGSSSSLSVRSTTCAAGRLALDDLLVVGAAVDTSLEGIAT